MSIQKARPAIGDQPAESQPKRIRAVGEDRLTTAEMRRRFAKNLDRLIGLLGISRKDVAEEMDVPYVLVRRLVTAGISRTDDRGADDMAKIAAYFGLSDPNELWRADLIAAVLDPNGSRSFIEKFRPRLIAERERRLAELYDGGVVDELGLLGLALGLKESPSPTLSGAIVVKISAILTSAKAEAFKLLVDDYHELVKVLAMRGQARHRRKA